MHALRTMLGYGPEGVIGQHGDADINNNRRCYDCAVTTHCASQKLSSSTDLHKYTCCIDSLVNGHLLISA